MFKNLFEWFGLSRTNNCSKSQQRSPFNGSRLLHHEQLEDRRMLATLTISTSADSGVVPVNDGILHLREAITYVNKTVIPGSADRNAWIDETVDLLGINDKIIFAPSLGGQTITLNEGNTGLTRGKELTITKSVIIDATMLSGGLTIAGTGGTDGNVGTGNGTTVIDIVTPAEPDGESFTYELAGLTITGGDDDDNLEGIDRGGGITFRNGSTVPIPASNLGQVSLTIRDSFVTGNHSRGDGGGIYSGFNPAQIISLDSIDLVIERSVISGNTSDDDGGGITVNMPVGYHADATGLVFTLSESIVESNEAVNRGGGIFLDSGAGGVIDIKDSTISGNKAGLALSGFEGEIPNSGGGIYAYLFSGDDGIVLREGEDKFAKLTITGTTVDNNKAGDHGGGILICTKREDETILVRSNVEIRNSTLSDNSAGVGDPSNTDPDFGEGGGIHIAIFQLPTFPDDVEGVDVLFEHVTITENEAFKGGGIFSLKPTQEDSETNTKLNNTILSGNKNYAEQADNFYGSINAAESTYNLLGPGNTFFEHAEMAVDPASGFQQIFFPSTVFPSSNINNSDNIPKLAPLELNGGPTKTHAPNANSLVIDKGEHPYTGETFDQRGDPFDRVVGGRLDIGAVELQSLADFDHDSDVDGSDFLAWQRGFGTIAPNATKADGDADNDQDVDAVDLAIWQSQYGLGAAAAASSSMQGGGGGSSSMMQSRASSQANVTVPQAVNQKIVPQLTLEEAAEKKEALFQLQKSFVEFLFKADLIQDVTEDGLIDRADLRVLLEPMLKVHPEIETDRLIREIRIPTETVASFDDALEELLGEEKSLSTATVDSAVELL